MKKILSPAQGRALAHFAKESGRSWRTDLCSAWETDNYAAHENAVVLRSIRDQFGFDWLRKFKLKTLNVFSPPQFTFKLILTQSDPQEGRFFGTKEHWAAMIEQRLNDHLYTAIARVIPQ